MAKLSSINNNLRRKKIISAKKTTRDHIKAKLQDKGLSFEERMALTHKLAEMPRNASPTRFRNRCELTGRPRGYYRKFGLSRIALREYGSFGGIPGLVKASW